MKRTTQQQNLLAALYEAARQQTSQIFCYKPDWLGYLPFAQYYWLKMSGTDIKVTSPDTLQDNFENLAYSGLASARVQ